MTYDAMLAARGWGPQHFDLASTAMLAGARFALYAERMVSFITEHEQLRSMSTDGLDVRDKAKVGSAQIAAANVLERVRLGLFPEDPDG